MTIVYHESVLNTVDYDFQRFNELKTHAKQLAFICEEGEQFVNGFIQIIGDVWFAFYSIHVQMLSDKKNVHPYHVEFIEHLLALEHYKSWHMYTQCDDLLSVLTTITIGEQLLHFIKQDEKVKKSSYERKIAERKKQIAENRLDKVKTRLLSKAEDDLVKFQLIANEKLLKKVNTELENANEIGVQKIVAYKERLTGTIVQASPQMIKKRQVIVSLSALNSRKINHLPLKEQLKLAEAIAQNKMILEIVEMAGRFIKIAKKKMKTMYNQTMERKNITRGNELSRLLPLEFTNYLMPFSRLDFLLRYSDSRTVMYDRKGKERRGRGPIILCMDESSSMHALRTDSKAFSIALLMIAQKQKRDFVIIPFSSDVGEVQYFDKDQTNLESIITFSEQFLGGGTNFEKPLRQAISIVMRSRFNEADVLFITDGSSFLSSSFVKEFNAIKKQRKFECISIVLTNANNPVNLSVVHTFSEKVIEVNNLFEAVEVFSL